MHSHTRIAISEIEERKLCEQCNICQEQIRRAKQQGLTELWINTDNHVSVDPTKLEDRAKTFRQYGV